MTLMMMLLAAGAAAQDTTEESPALDVQLFRPSIDATHLLWTDESTRGTDRAFSGRTFVSWMADPLVYLGADGSRTEVVSDVLQLNLIGAYTWDRFRVGLDAPVVLRSLGDELAGESGLGDISADAKVTVLEREDAPIGLAFSARFGAPTSTLEGPLGSPGATFELSAIADRRIGDALVALNLGHRAIPGSELENLEWNDQVAARLGVGYTLTDAVGASLDLAGKVVYRELGNPNAAPFEGLIGGWFRPGGGDLLIRGGGGTGLGTGIGAPVARLALSVGYLPVAERDADLDGLVDGDDQCPAAAEDADGYQDGDGCPEPTEVALRFKGPDGAPLMVDYVLSDLTGRADSGELSLALEPGSYTLEASSAGFLPATVVLEVPPGAPWYFIHTLEPVPVAPAPVVVVSEPVAVVPEQIELADTIGFKLGSATLKIESEVLLDEVADILKAHPEVALLRIEGHTDSQGDAGYNLQLSEARAAAVRDYLITQGIDPERLTSAGYGESRPVEDLETPAAWEKNRRVDFFVEKRTD